MIGQKNMKKVKYFKYLGSMITHVARCTPEIKSSFTVAEIALNKMKTPLSTKLVVNVRKKQAKCYILSIVFYGVET
jgi:hypothetical protein